MSDRNYWIDNLKLFLTLMVISHHAAIAYGAEGLFGLNHPAADPVTSTLLTFFVAVNQSYFMGLFFFLSALFSPASIDRSGPLGFLKKRAYRLGLPLLISVLFVRPAIAYIIANCRDDNPGGYLPFARGYLLSWGGELGPLWFLAALLLFHAAYAFIVALCRRLSLSFPPFPIPGRRSLIIMVAYLIIFSWLLRIFYPVGESILFGFQIGHFAQYILAYALGVTASRGRWLDRLGSLDLRPWGITAVVLLILLPPAVVGTGFMGMGIEGFMGGGGLLSLIYALFEALAFISFTLCLMGLFRRRFNRSSEGLKRINRETFFVYFIHELCLIILIGSYYNSSLAPPLLFVIVTLLGIATSFSMSFFLRRAPLLRSVF